MRKFPRRSVRSIVEYTGMKALPTSPQSSRRLRWPQRQRLWRRASVPYVPATASDTEEERHNQPGYSLLGALSIGTGLVMIVLIFVLIFAVFSSVFRVQESTRWARHSQTVERDLHELLTLVTSAESNQRGFLLTNDSAYLEPYASDQHEIEIRLNRLNLAANEDYMLRRELRQASTLIRAKFTEMQAALDQMQSDQPDRALDSLRSGRGRELTHQIQLLDDSAHAAEQKMTDAWEAEQRTWEHKALRIVAAIAVLGVLLVLTAVCVVMLYLSQRARAERELREARDQAVEANRAKSRFLAAASHDLRQPLHALNLLLRTLERRMGDGRDAELVHSARAASMSMARMFNGLLDISRLDAGVIEPRVENFSIAVILEDLRVHFASSAREKGLSFDIVPNDTTLATDRTLLESILSNLVANAINYTPHGSITVLTRDGDDVLTIEICDTGQGIPEDEQERIFDEFHRLEHGHSGQGLGLGLSIVRRLSRLLDIEIELRSKPGQGSVFALRIPHSIAAPVDATPAPPPARIDPVVDLRGKTVLLVDDEPLGREAMRCEMGDWGMKVVMAADAEEALSFLAMHQIQLDVAIVDRDLGSHLTGPDLLDRLATDLGIAVPAIVITGATDSETLQDLEDMGYTYLIKPVDEITLRRALNVVMAEVSEDLSDLDLNEDELAQLAALESTTTQDDDENV